MQGKEDTVACPALTAEHAAAIHDDAFAFAGDARFWPRRELEALRRRRPRAPAAAGSADGAPVALWEHAATSTSISYDFYGRARVEFEIRATVRRGVQSGGGAPPPFPLSPPLPPHQIDSLLLLPSLSTAPPPPCSAHCVGRHHAP